MTASTLLFAAVAFVSASARHLYPNAPSIASLQKASRLSPLRLHIDAHLRELDRPTRGPPLKSSLAVPGDAVPARLV